MRIYGEGILWYLLLIDCLVYLYLSWTKGKHKFTHHWASDYIPLEKGVSILYLILVLWLGYTLWRMQLIFNW